MRKPLFTAALAAGLALHAAAAAGAEVKLRAVSTLVMDSQFGKIFSIFVDRVNSEGKGLVQIQVLGGPEAIPPFEQGTAVKNGVVDLAHLAANYYENLMPEAIAASFGTIGPRDQRKSGGWAYFNKLHNEKVNAYYLTSYGWGINFYIYLNSKVDKPNLTGLKLRSPPGMLAFVKSLGATSVATAPGEIYTALERGVVNGYIWPLWGVNDFGLQRVTKYRLEPGFSSVHANIVVNLATWNRLEPAQRGLLEKSALWFEEHTERLIADWSAAERKKQADAGIQIIEFPGAMGEQYRKRFYDAAWQSVEQRSPQHGAKIKALVNR
jgi:TRAP-type C4-dicarboxylate transport system substrate-binding protein